MEITERNTGLGYGPDRKLKQEWFERSKVACQMYIEYLRLRSLMLEERGERSLGILLGSTSEQSKSFVFNTPFVTGDQHIYTVLTLQGFRSIIFDRTPEGIFVNQGVNLSEGIFVESMIKFKQESQDPELHISAQFQGYTTTHTGREIFRCPSPAYPGFKALLSFPLEDSDSDAVQYTLDTLSE